MAVSGIFSSDSGITSNRSGDFMSSLIKIMPASDSLPFMKMTTGMRSAPATDAIVNWYEENFVTSRVTISNGGNVAAGDTTMTLTSGHANYFVPGALLLVEEHGEYLLVKAVTGDQITVARGIGNTTPATITDGGYLQKITTAFEESSNAPNPISFNGYPRVNNCQIFRNSWGLSKTAQSTAYRTGSQKPKKKSEAAWEHALDQERAYLFGVLDTGVQNGEPIRFTEGVFNQIKTNRTVSGASLSRKQLDDFLKGVFKYNIKGQPNERIGMVGYEAIGHINDIAYASAHYNLQAEESVFGLRIMRWVTTYGSLSLMINPLFTENDLWTQNLYVFHPGAIERRVLRETHNEETNKDNGVDADTGTLTTEACMTYAAELTGGILSDIDSGVA